MHANIHACMSQCKLGTLLENVDNTCTLHF